MKCANIFRKEVAPRFLNVMDTGSDVTTVPDAGVGVDTLLDYDMADGMGDVWNSFTICRPEAENNRQRHHRSRSSPVRTIEGMKRAKVRTRSPSAFSPRKSRDHARERPLKRPSTYVPEHAVNSCSQEDCLQLGDSFWCGPRGVCGSAFFSFSPPAIPLRIVPVVTPTPPPLPPPLHPGVRNVGLKPFAQKPSKECESIAKNIIEDLVDFLPLTSSTPFNSKSRAGSPDPMEKYATRSPSSKSRRRFNSANSNRKQYVNRSIATQAKDLEEEEDTFQEMGRSVTNSSEGWIGGVRALRDSHVKLVLRQLRHINRLNRALDRASRPPLSPTRVTKQ